MVAVYWGGDRLEDLANGVVRVIPKLPRRVNASREAIGTMDAGWSLILIALLDALSSFQPAMRLAYVVPAWLAMARGGLLPAIGAAVATSLVGTWSDYQGGLIGHGSVMANFLLRAALLAIMIFILDQKDRALRTTREDASRDPLTGAANRGRIDAFTRDSIDAAVMSGTDLAVVMIDCDRFKELNDYHGHALGDQVLRMLVRQFESEPHGGLLGRTGGDEFVLVMPGRHGRDVYAMVERVQARFNDSTLVIGARASFSYGIASLREDGISWEALSEAADRDMYRRKVTKRSSGCFDSSLL